MQFIVKRDILLRSLNFVQGVVEKKNTLPILSNVLLQLKDKKLNNLKFGISGIEKLFDKKLLGKDGWIKLETNSKGRIKKELNKNEL